MDDCKRMQNMIVPFELDKLSLHDEEIFIEHLSTCQDCREEFEIHYIVAYGLEDDDNIVPTKPEYKRLLDSYDFTGLVDLKIRNSMKKIRAIKKQNKYNRFVWLACNSCMLVTFIVFIIIKYY
ncbi:MAG: hypothetical protein PHW47_06795 [Lachnospira sp.]|nr:hypothetical protein [Lachnospira sp.]